MDDLWQSVFDRKTIANVERCYNLSNCSKLNFNLDFEATKLRDFEMSRILATSMPRFQYVN